MSNILFGHPFIFDILKKIFLKIFTRLAQPITRKSNMNILVFTFFVFLSSIFWVSININKRYIENIEYPVKFENFPSNRLQVGDLPEHLTITVEASGFVILKHKIWSTVDPINFNVSDCYLYPLSRKDTSKLFALTKNEGNQVAAQLANDIRIMDISPDTILFNFEVLRIKKVPVIGDVDITCERQFMLAGKIHFKPDSLYVSGPSSVIDTLTAAYTEHIVIKNANEPINRNITVKKIPGTDSEKRKLRLIADIDKFTETKLSIPITPINVPDSLILKTFPKKVALSYLVPFKHFEKISPSNFLVTADYNKIDGNSEKLKVNLEKEPLYIKTLGWEPKYIDYIIEKR